MESELMSNLSEGRVFTLLFTNIFILRNPPGLKTYTVNNNMNSKLCNEVGKTKFHFHMPPVITDGIRDSDDSSGFHSTKLCTLIHTIMSEM